jgi:4-oxalocrotonate tautomerase
MPHIIVKMYAGQSQEVKRRIAEGVAKVVMAETGKGEDAFSVSIEDFAPAEWMEKVYGPDIERGPGELFKRPGYGPLAGKP